MPPSLVTLNLASRAQARLQRAFAQQIKFIYSNYEYEYQGYKNGWIKGNEGTTGFIMGDAVQCSAVSHLPPGRSPLDWLLSLPPLDPPF